MTRQTKIVIAVFAPIVGLYLAVLYGMIVSIPYDHAFRKATLAHDWRAASDALCGKERAVWFLTLRDQCRR